MLFEFDLSYTVNTGSLGNTFTGSGVHLNRDVSFSLDLIDQQQNIISNDQQLIANPLVTAISFDILGPTGNIIYTGYKSGTNSRTLTITAIENESIFGNYTKDFGIRATVTNPVNSNLFVADFYAYGNIPVVSNYNIVDSTASYLQESIYDRIEVDVEFQNNLKYVNIERFDIYCATGDVIDLPVSGGRPSNNPYFLYSQNVQSVADLTKVVIKPISVVYDTEYFFKIVPYSSLGSGASIDFGPRIFRREVSGGAPAVLGANQFELFDGTGSANFTFFTGFLNTSDAVLIDSIESGLYRSLVYEAQFCDGTGYYTHTNLKLLINNTGATLSEVSVNNTGQLIFSTDQSGLFTNLYVSGVNPTGGNYKIYKTSI
jgi:hypothetical protein